MVFPILWYRLRIPSRFVVFVVGSRSRPQPVDAAKRRVPLTLSASAQGGDVLTDAEEPDVHDVTNLLITPRDEGLHGGRILGAHSELEYRPSGSVRGNPQSAIVRLDDRTANRQTHPHAI